VTNRKERLVQLDSSKKQKTQKPQTPTSTERNRRARACREKDTRRNRYELGEEVEGCRLGAIKGTREGGWWCHGRLATKWEESPKSALLIVYITTRVFVAQPAREGQGEKKTKHESARFQLWRGVTGRKTKKGHIRRDWTGIQPGKETRKRSKSPGVAADGRQEKRSVITEPRGESLGK